MTLIEEKLGYEFQNRQLLKQALSHKSYDYEMTAAQNGNNEKLEFLGDAVVDLILSDLLMKQFPDDSEGSLSKKRASLVNESILAQVAQNLMIHTEVLLGKGEAQSGGQGKPRILASAYEAILGAIFVEAGYPRTRDLVEQHFGERITSVGDREAGADDFKTRLQEEVQALLKVTPVYQLVSESGPPHERLFAVEVKVRGVPITQAQGRSKKIAEQEAARLALNLWRNSAQ